MVNNKMIVRFLIVMFSVMDILFIHTIGFMIQYLIVYISIHAGLKPPNQGNVIFSQKWGALKDLNLDSFQSVTLRMEGTIWVFLALLHYSIQQGRTVLGSYHHRGILDIVIPTI